MGVETGLNPGLLTDPFPSKELLGQRDDDARVFGGALRSHSAKHIQICSVGSSLSRCEGFAETLLRSLQFKPKVHQCLHKFFLSLFR
jgi:hypothetical protein